MITFLLRKYRYLSASRNTASRCETTIRTVLDTLMRTPFPLHPSRHHPRGVAIFSLSYEEPFESSAIKKRVNANLLSFGTVAKKMVAPLELKYPSWLWDVYH